MALIGNWQAKSSGAEARVWGRVGIIARDGAILEVAVQDTDNWETIHTFPPTEGEYYILDLPTDTRIRISNGGAWTYSRFNIQG